MSLGTPAWLGKCPNFPFSNNGSGHLNKHPEPVVWRNFCGGTLWGLVHVKVDGRVRPFQVGLKTKFELSDSTCKWSKAADPSGGSAQIFVRNKNNTCFVGRWRLNFPLKRINRFILLGCLGSQRAGASQLPELNPNSGLEWFKQQNTRKKAFLTVNVL